MLSIDANKCSKDTSLRAKASVNAQTSTPLTETPSLLSRREACEHIQSMFTTLMMNRLARDGWIYDTKGEAKAKLKIIPYTQEQYQAALSTLKARGMSEKEAAANLEEYLAAPSKYSTGRQHPSENISLQSLQTQTHISLGIIPAMRRLLKAY